MHTNLKVYLLSGFHPIYESIIRNPPTNVNYISLHPLSVFDSLEIYRKGYEIKKKILIKILNGLRLPRIFFVTKNCDLIHSCRGILILNRKPWIVDIEHAGSFGNYLKINKRIVNKLLSSNYCKKILPHCMAAGESLKNAYDTSNFKQKIEILYPAISTHWIKGIKRKYEDKLTLLFIGKGISFYRKGGKEILQAFDILNKKYDIKLIMKTEPPEEIKRKYGKRDNIEFFTQTISRNELFLKLYAHSDIFVFPTYVDSFGYVLLEAMVARLPLVATNIFAIPEIIEDGKNGFLIHTPISDFDSNFLYKFKYYDIGNYIKRKNFPVIVKQLVEKLSLLIEDSSLRRKMGRYGRRLVEKGKFSIKERNRKLREIYEEALV
ncbi:MAG: glycosyltransferase family 4 protein [Candidatus Aenigmatarchaeota archaeon]